MSVLQAQAVGLQDQIAKAYAHYTEDEKALLKKAGLLFTGEVTVSLNGASRTIKSRFIILKGIDYKKRVKRGQDQGGTTFKWVYDDSHDYSTKPCTVSIVTDRSRRIVGDWRNGLTPAEVSAAMGTFKLEEYKTNRREEGKSYHETRITVHANRMYDMTIPSDMAEFRVLLANKVIEMCEDMARIEGRTHYWHKKEDSVKRLKSKAEKGRRIMKLLGSMTNMEKAMAMIVSLYKAEDNIPQGYDISDLAEELDSLLLEDPNRLYNVIGNEVPVYTQLVLVHAIRLGLLVKSAEDNHYYNPAEYNKEAKLFSKGGLAVATTLVTQKGQDLIATLKQKMTAAQSPVERDWKMISSKDLNPKPENTPKYTLNSIQTAEEDMLKRIAVDLDVTFSPKIGVDTLRKRVIEAFSKNTK